MARQLALLPGVGRHYARDAAGRFALARPGAAALRRLPSVKLDASAGATDGAPAPGPTSPRWVQVAYSGLWRGHRVGEFALTAREFAQVVDNFHAHPKYKPGAATASPEEIGSGAFDVVPWDFDHASTADKGEKAVTGAPAQGWILEVEVRPGPDGKPALYALSRFLEPLASYILEHKYHWCSVVIGLSSVHPETGAEIGAYLSSVAATNDPFLQNLTPLQIAAGRGFDPYNAPSTPAEVLSCMRELFGLPDLAGAEQVIAELSKLRAFTSGATPSPAGINVVELVGGLRQILNLPTLASVDDVFAATDGLLAALAADPGSAANVAPQGAAAPLHREGSPPMAMNAAQYAALLAVVAPKEPTATPERAIECTRIALEKGADATAKLTAILQGLGVPDSDAALQKIVEDARRSKALLEAFPELEEMLGGEAKAEAETATADVDKAMAAHNMPDVARVALEQLRTGGVAADRLTVPAKGAWTDADHKRVREALAARRAARKAFAELYRLDQAAAPAASDSVAGTHLLGRVFAGTERSPVERMPGGRTAELSAAQFAHLPANLRGELQGHKAPADGGAIDLSREKGRNEFERALSVAERQTPAEEWKTLDLGQKHDKARAVLAIARMTPLRRVG